MARLSGLLALALVLSACPGGRDKWIADLQSARPEERALAVKKLAEKFEEEDLGLFTQAARDPNPMVRAEAMRALGRSEEPLVLDLLGEGLGDSDEDVQVAAAAALAGNRSEKARGYLLLQFGRRGRSTRRAIVEALKATNVPGAMASAIAAEAKTIWDRNLKVLQEGALPERVGAAEELGRSGRPEAVNRLVPLLKDNQVILAAAAARGLGFAGDARSVPALAELLKENFPELREAACDALKRLKSPEALPALKAVALERSPASSLATSALLSLPPSEETNGALCELLLAGDPAQVTAVGRELRARGGCPQDALADKLRNASTAPAALAAVVALGPTLKELTPRVTPFLTSSDRATRRLAVEALTELGDMGAAGALLKAWDSELKILEPLRTDWIAADLKEGYARGFDPDIDIPADDPTALVRMRTSDLFHKIQARDAERAKESGRLQPNARVPRELIDDADDDEVQVAAALLRAFARLKVDGARERALMYTRDQSPVLRAAAFASLAALGGESLAQAREGLLETDAQVQADTAEALAAAGEAGQVMVLEVARNLSGDRSRLLEALKGKPLSAACAPALIAIVSEGAPDAGFAALLLADTRAPEAVDPLLKLLDGPTGVSRGDVVTALGRLGDKRAAERVSRELYSERPGVRAAAAEALGRLGGGPTPEALDALRGDYYVSVRERATAALAMLNPEGKP